MYQSPNDHKQYRHLVLANQLRVLLIHDPSTARAAAALSVRAGHFDDPVDRQGMAHFLEHMLFLGTQSYPHPGSSSNLSTATAAATMRGPAPSIPTTFSR